MELRTQALAFLLRALATEPVVRSDPELACDTAPLAHRIEDLVGRPVDDGEVGVHVEILEADPLRARVALEFGGRHEVRELEAPSCDALLDAVALLVAVTLDPDAAVVPPPPEPVPEPPPEPLPEPEPEPEPLPEPEPEPAPLPAPTPELPPPTEPTPPPEPRPLGLAIGLLAGGEIGAIPRGTGGLRPVIRLARGAFMAELSGDYWIRRRHQALASGESLTVELGVAAARACGVVRRGRVRTPLCGGIEAGLMRGAPIGLRDARNARFPWVAGLASAAILVRLGRRVDLTAAAEGFVTIVRPRFQAVRDDGSVVQLYVPSPVGVRLLAGITIELLSVTEGAR